MPGRTKQEAFVTLSTNDTYSLGCLVLGYSLRRVNTSRQLVVMVTKGVSNPMRSQLAQVFDLIQEVDVLDSNDPINLSLLGRPDLNVTFTKLHCWRLTQFSKAVFLDADTLVLQDIDELFDRDEFSAAPDAGWPDCFNSGVFVFKPSLETYKSLLEFATTEGSFDGGDQGLLNMYFKSWATADGSKRLPFTYNVVSQAFYSYLPAFTQFKDRVKVVHFIGAVKPWHQTYNVETRTVTALPGTGHSQEFLQVWWNIFMQMVQPILDPSLVKLVGELRGMTVSEKFDGSDLSDAERKVNWEKGQIDYLGRDSFENIQKKMEETLKSKSSSDTNFGGFGVAPLSPPTKEINGKQNLLTPEQILEPVKQSSTETLSAKPPPTKTPSVIQPSKAPSGTLPAKPATATMLAQQPTAALPAQQPTAALPAQQPTAALPAQQPTAALPAQQPSATLPAKPATATLPAQQPTATLPAKTPAMPTPSKPMSINVASKKK